MAASPTGAALEPERGDVSGIFPPPVISGASRLDGLIAAQPKIHYISKLCANILFYEVLV